jgi:DNA-binding response OmpR family regulator
VSQPDRTPVALVVDDDPVILTLLRHALRGEGFAVLTAERGQAGVELFRRAAAPVDVALLDVRMPGLDGPATLAELRAIDPGLPCCFMTGESGGYDPGDLLAAGADTVIDKPFRLDDVAPRLRALLRSGPTAHERR